MTPIGEAVFYIQATAATGMGHLARSAALIDALDARGFASQVVLRVDKQGRALAHDRGLTAREIPVQNDAPPPARTVIDAVTVPEGDAGILARSPQRILISPICDRAEIATHAMLRTVPEALHTRLVPGCVVIQDDRFAYVTAAGLTPRHLDHHDKLVVGICLSGGAGQPDIGALLNAARSAPGVAAVHVIHPQGAELSGPGLAVYHHAFSENPWHDLASINVFVGGDGVMIAEAVAQGLPCLSVISPGAGEKNWGLAEAGCVEVCQRDNAPMALTALLSDPERLSSMHRAALAQTAAQDAGALARAIAQLAQNSGN